MTAPAKEDLLLRGTPEVTVTVASSADHGMLSAQLVDLGTAKRLTSFNESQRPSVRFSLGKR